MTVFDLHTSSFSERSVKHEKIYLQWSWSKHFCKNCSHTTIYHTSVKVIYVFSAKESGKGGDHEEKNKPSDKPETNTTEKIADKPSPEKEEGKFLVTLLIN